MRGDSTDFDGLPGDAGATLTQLYRSIVYTTMMKLRVIMPAEVVSYTPPVPGQSPAMVTVRPHFQSAREIDNPAELTLGEILVEQTDRLLALKPLPNIPNRPVMYLGHAGMRMSGPLEVGEVGLYLVCDRSIDQWINTGGPLDPSTSELHDLTDGVFIPGLRSGNVAQDIPSDVDRVGREDGTAGMTINREPLSPDYRSLTLATEGLRATLDASTELLLGAGATRGVARLADTTSADTSMAVWIAAVNAALAAGVPTVVAPPTDFGVISSASTKVRSE